MIIADLDQMEARVDIGEVDVVLIAPGQIARLEVDAFRDRKFRGVVTEIANSSRTAGMAATAGQEATKFEVKIRIQEKETFRPGMSVMAEVETRYRTNVLAVPIQSVTTRLPKVKTITAKAGVEAHSSCSNGVQGAECSGPKAAGSASDSRNGEKKVEPAKPIEVVFGLQGDRAVVVPVKRGISDDAYTEIVEGVHEGLEVVSGGYKAISRDLEDGKKAKKGPKPDAEQDKDRT
jgi:HlyD family secretion protein